MRRVLVLGLLPLLAAACSAGKDAVQTGCAGRSELHVFISVSSRGSSNVVQARRPSAPRHPELAACGRIFDRNAAAVIESHYGANVTGIRCTEGRAGNRAQGPRCLVRLERGHCNYWFVELGRDAAAYELEPEAVAACRGLHLP
jgi:hypothetical protein